MGSIVADIENYLIDLNIKQQSTNQQSTNSYQVRTKLLERLFESYEDQLGSVEGIYGIVYDRRATGPILRFLEESCRIYQRGAHSFLSNMISRKVLDSKDRMRRNTAIKIYLTDEKIFRKCIALHQILNNPSPNYNENLTYEELFLKARIEKGLFLLALEFPGRDLKPLQEARGAYHAAHSKLSRIEAEEAEREFLSMTCDPNFHLPIDVLNRSEPTYSLVFGGILKGADPDKFKKSRATS
jgi:hypothetical protein